jgi:hypothetical protein
VWRRASLVGERETAHRDRTATFEHIGPLPPAGPRSAVADDVRRQPPPALGDAREALAAGGLQADYLPQPGQRGAAAIGLLECEPLLVGTARGAHDRRRVDPLGQRERDRGERLRPAVPRALHRHLQARGETLLVGDCELERARGERRRPTDRRSASGPATPAHRSVGSDPVAIVQRA